MRTMLLVATLVLSQLAFADLTVYTDRPQARFANAVKLFEKQTGQKVTFVEAGYKDLLKKIESDTQSADLIITKDLVNLNDLVKRNHLQAMRSTKAVNSVHSFMREDNLKWVALTYRVRSVVYDSAQINASEFSTYEDLASAKWRGQVCLRTSSADYTKALVAHMIGVYGEDSTRQIVTGWLANRQARNPTDQNPESIYSSDTTILNEIENGNCSIGIVNHYYLAGFLNSKPLSTIKMAFLDQAGQGVHSNGTGVGVIAGSRQQTLAQAFIDILLSKDIQLEVSAVHFDYPAVASLKPSTFIKDWGTFKLSPLKWSEVGELVATGEKMMKEVGYK